MKDRKKELIGFIVDTLSYLERESKNTYDILEPFLQESSHSFGFSPFAKAHEKFVNGIDQLLNMEEASYLYYENFGEISKEGIYERLIEFEIKTEDLLKLIFSIMKDLYEENHRIGKIFSLFIVDLFEDPAKHCFKPIDDILKYMEDNLDFYIFKELNEGASEGWIYWFLVENEYGKREFKTSYNGVEYLINNEETFLMFLEELEKEV